MGKKGKTSVGRVVLKHRSKGGNLGKGKESWVCVMCYNLQVLYY